MDAQLDLLHAAAANDTPSGFGSARFAPAPRAPTHGAANGARLGELLGSLSHALDLIALHCRPVADADVA